MTTTLVLTQYARLSSPLHRIERVGDGWHRLFQDEPDAEYDFISKRRCAYLLSAAFITLGLLSIGAMSLTDREISLPVLAAVLTIIGYSVNDTIVAYDRVRENRGKGVRKGISFAEQINTAINQTYSTIYIAGALIVDWTAWAEARARRAQKAKAAAKA